MQLNSLNGRAKAAKAEVPKTLVIRLVEIVSDAKKPTFFHGVNVDTNEPVKVRLMTVDEGALVNKRANETLEQAKARISNQYIGTDAKHRPTPKEFGTKGSKVYCEAGGIISFTKVLSDGNEGEPGAFRAHWAETLESGPGATCQKVKANVDVAIYRDRDNPELITGKAVNVDLMKPESATILTKDNIIATLKDAFVETDAEGARRKPFVLLRLIEKDTGLVYAGMPGEIRVNAATLKEEGFDHDNGVPTEVYRTGTPDETLAKIIDPATVTRDEVVLRSVLFGLSTQEGYPDLSQIEDAGKRQDFQTICDAVRSGDYVAEAIPGERISAGPATRASILKAYEDNPNHPFHQYRGTEYLPTDVDGKIERKERKNVKLYFDTYVTSVVKDGYRFFTKASRADLHEKKASLFSVATPNDHAATAEAARTRVADASTQVVEAEPEEFDAGMVNELDEQLAKSAAAAELSM
ncbi:hypothetical protein [Ralstonia sp. ASV6]|uniref:hypothetical protein n=1 Tax=Ralstonia sp. ASV6 TaxID=2795124 RepID=UPI0018ECAF8D|nr:hypothetical protein [Ralstonia sp. ASV6]